MPRRIRAVVCRPMIHHPLSKSSRCMNRGIINQSCTSKQCHDHGQRTMTIPRTTSFPAPHGFFTQKYIDSHLTGASAALRQLPASWLQNFESLGSLHAAARHPYASRDRTALPWKRWSASLARAPLLWLHHPILPLLLRTPT